LELLLLVVEQVYPFDPDTPACMQPNFRFEDIKLHQESKQRWDREFGSLEQYQKTLQMLLSQGYDHVTPTVVVVKEAWSLPTESAFCKS
jgi:hypothetical protein